MAVTTWDGSSSTDWNTAANWDTGAVPTSSDDVIIPDTSSINNCELSATGGNPKNVNSLQIQANGTIVGGGIQIRVYGENGSGFAVDNDGIISGSLFLEIKTPSATKLDLMGSSGNFNSVTINHASCDAFLEANTTIDGNLTITLGKLTCTTEAGDARTLTVAGHTEIGPASGSADQATLTATSQDLVLGSGITNQYGLIVNQGGTFVGGSGAHTLGGLKVANNSNAKCTLTSGVTTINGEHSSDNFNTVIYSGSTFDNADGTVTYTGMESSIYWQKNAHNIILNTSNTIIIGNALVLDNNLTITQGTLTTSGSNNALTVTGDASVTGTLTGNASAISLGSLTIESGGTYSATSGTTTITSFINNKSIVNNSGTFTHNSGTVVIDVTNSNKTMVDARATYHNLTINSDGSNKEVELNNLAATIEGNLTVQEGKLFTYATSGRHLTVTGDVSIEDGGEIDMNNAAGKNATFGSLTIASGGTYTATTGTTTITDEVSATDYSWLNSGGTFTHNNGKVILTEDSNCKVKENAFYDFELNLNSATTDCDIEDASGNTITFFGDLTITRGRMQTTTTTDEIIIHGNTYVAVTHATLWHDADQATNKITHHGIVTNLGTYKINDGTTVKMNGGIRQLGTLSID